MSPIHCRFTISKVSLDKSGGLFFGVTSKRSFRKIKQSMSILRKNLTV
jgi:hypothetical protein